MSRRAVAILAFAAGACVAVGGAPPAAASRVRPPRSVKVSTVRFDTGDVIDLIPPENIRLGRPPAPTRHLPFLTALAARPKTKDAKAAVLVIHDAWGLDAAAIEFAVACAARGLPAYAVDALSPYGGTPGGRAARDRDRARRSIGQLDPEKTLAKLSIVLHALEFDGATVGVAGFGWGADVAIGLASTYPSIAAVVAYTDDASTLALSPVNTLLVPLAEQASPRSIKQSLNFLNDRLRP